MPDVTVKPKKPTATAAPAPRYTSRAGSLAAPRAPVQHRGRSLPSTVYRPDPTMPLPGKIQDTKKWLEAQYGQPVDFFTAQAIARDNMRPAAPNPAPARFGGRAGGGGGRGGGGGGGGGGPNAQAMMDYLSRLLGSDIYKAQPLTGLREAIGTATTQDQAAATGAYNTLDQYLQANQTNPYANVQLQAAQRAPDMNPFLQSQGMQTLAPQGANAEDTGFGAFHNVLALLGAGQQAANQSRGVESQMARTFAGQQIGAMDNSMLAQVAAQEAARQQALDQERRQALLQLAELVGQGATAPTGLGF
jgi:hypothetical protein